MPIFLTGSLIFFSFFLELSTLINNIIRGAILIFSCYFVGLFSQNISKGKQKLIESEEKYRGILDNNKEGYPEFKEFKRVDSPFVDSIPGTGLGLPLTKKLINMHGGNVSFTSELGRGTIFKFTISKNLGKTAIKPDLIITE